MHMKVTLLGEAGHDQALYGLGLSHGITKGMTLKDFAYPALDPATIDKSPWMRMRATANKLATKDGGHNKFLEAIFVWLLVEAPRYWWQEADTYRLSTKQSESTMHTIHKGIAKWMFEDGAIQLETLQVIAALIQEINTTKDTDTKNQILVEIKQLLPESFLQQRVWCMSYKTLRNIIAQRHNHRLPHWKAFINQVLESVQEPGYLEVL